MRGQLETTSWTASILEVRVAVEFKKIAQSQYLHSILPPNSNHPILVSKEQKKLNLMVED